MPTALRARLMPEVPAVIWSQQKSPKKKSRLFFLLRWHKGTPVALRYKSTERVGGEETSSNRQPCTLAWGVTVAPLRSLHATRAWVLSRDSLVHRGGRLAAALPKQEAIVPEQLTSSSLSKQVLPAISLQLLENKQPTAKPPSRENKKNTRGMQDCADAADVGLRRALRPPGDLGDSPAIPPWRSSRESSPEGLVRKREAAEGLSRPLYRIVKRFKPMQEELIGGCSDAEINQTKCEGNYWKAVAESKCLLEKETS
uniref:Uncharacterized protein n=1 Tax=Sphaerodactylus townsendi TaxID=933632 RepID=A0ACB8EDE1_9SAUR